MLDAQISQQIQSASEWPSLGVSLSDYILGIHWNRWFPKSLGDDYGVELADYSTASQFISSHYKVIFKSAEEINPFLPDTEPEDKERYYQVTGDFFALTYRGAIVGMFLSNMQDWNSYYLRSAGILPEHQGKGLYKKFMGHLLEVLEKYKVERILVDIAPSNLNQINYFNKMEFNISGMNISERWGTLIQFTRFLKKDRESFFLNRFCGGVKPQLR
jgi:ribosomal protein S18 acetylase RimI-like enzyme